MEIENLEWLLQSDRKTFVMHSQNKNSLLNWVAKVFYYALDHTSLLEYLNQNKIDTELVAFLYLRVVELHESDFLEIFGPIEPSKEIPLRTRYKLFKEFPLEYRKIREGDNSV